MLTFLLVLVVLLVTGHGAARGYAGLAIGFTLAAIHLVGIPLTGTSVNPARSIGPALFQPSAWGQLWLSIVALLIGGLIGAVVVSALTKRSATDRGLEDQTAEARGGPAARTWPLIVN